MSNRFVNNRQDGNKGFAKTQKKYVPRSPNPTLREFDPNPTLSNSLRQSTSRQSDAVSTSSGGHAAESSSSRVRTGDNGGMVSSSRSHGGKFLNYLPQDEAVAAGFGAEEGGLDSVESQRVVDLLNKELSRLLKLNPRDFWREVISDSSLHHFLDNFLKYRSRWYDFPHRGAKGKVAGVIMGEYELSKRVFMVLYRISSNRDPGARAADSLSLKDHTVLLQGKKLLDVPKLFDICAIYGHDNEDLTRMLVDNALKAQPGIEDNFIAAVSHFLSIVHTMHQRCSSSLEVLFSSQGRKEHGSCQLSTDYLEVMDFINDAVVSMDGFITAYKPAAVVFSCPVELSSGNEDLLSTLSRIHDFLLPSLQHGFRILCDVGENGVGETIGRDMLSDIMLSLKMLSMRIVNFGWKLLEFCYLSDEVFEGNWPIPAAAKMFPAKVDDPVIRADILVQTLREISGGHPNVGEGPNRGTFLQNVEKHHHVMSIIDSLQSTGWFLMDGEQLQYLSLIMKRPSDGNSRESRPSNPISSTELQINEDAAIMESKVSQIKDLFPDYGKGFLSACLEVYNQNPEEVIQRILEGTLHEDLQSLDTSLETIPPPKSAAPASKNDKGKGKLLPVSTPAAATSNHIAPPVVAKGPTSSSSSAWPLIGRYTRKSKLELPDSATLNSRDDKDFLKTAALASQMEYEDEYDDSFDDLGLSVADSGLEEAESLGENNSSRRGKSWVGDSGTTPASNTSNDKWGSRRKPQFYVRDGKNYSYKVEGSVAVANYNEASLVNEAQKELIHGLGRGGNMPLGAVRKLTMESNENHQDGDDTADVGGGQGNPGSGRGRGRRGGGGGGRSNHYRKDRAMKKHFSGVTGH